MLEIHKNFVLDESQKPIAVQIPIEEFERLEEVIENYGLAKLMGKVSEDEQLSFQEAKSVYKSFNMKLTAVFQKVPEGYIGFVEELPRANTQGNTLEEALANLHEAVRLVLGANHLLAEESVQGSQKILKEEI